MCHNIFVFNSVELIYARTAHPQKTALVICFPDILRCSILMATVCSQWQLLKKPSGFHIQSTPDPVVFSVCSTPCLNWTQCRLASVMKSCYLHWIKCRCSICLRTTWHKAGQREWNVSLCVLPLFSSVFCFFWPLLFSFLILWQRVKPLSCIIETQWKTTVRALETNVDQKDASDIFDPLIDSNIQECVGKSVKCIKGGWFNLSRTKIRDNSKLSVQ